MEQMVMDFSGLIQLAILALLLVAAWTLLRFVFRLAKTLFYMGCALIALAVAGAVFIMVLGTY